MLKSYKSISTGDTAPYVAWAADNAADVYAEQKRKTGSSFLLTNSGTCGMCPDRTKPGDLIVTFCGSDYPVVLRRKLQPGTRMQATMQELKDGPKHELIGTCELYGEMSGATLDRHDFEDVLHAEPPAPLPVKHGFCYCMRGEHKVRFWDLV